jgi:hypothetical protein
MIPGIAVAFVLGFMVMGGVASSPDSSTALGQMLGTTPAAAARLPASSALVPPEPMLSSNPLVAATLHWKQVLSYWFGYPSICWGDNAVNDFQRSQCVDFHDRLITGTLIALIPTGVALLFLFLAVEQLSGFYRRSRKTIDKGKALFAGVVTNPAEAPNDFFGRTFCMRAISVQLSNKKQMNVYLPLTAPVPLPGQTLAVFDGGKVLGAKRYIATLYAPHLAVVSGSR